MTTPSADCVGEEDRFKFVNDLSVLEICNLISIELTCYNVKTNIPSDIIQSNQFIPSINLKPKDYLDKISLLTRNQKMIINEKKSKTMVFNITRNY
jgi:hypothetical protein